MTDRIAPTPSPTWIDRMSDIPVVGSPAEEVVKGIDRYIVGPLVEQMTRGTEGAADTEPATSPASPLPTDPTPGLGSLLQDHMKESLSELDSANDSLRESAEK